MKIRAVFLDAAHTIIEPYPASARVYSEIAQRHGLDVAEKPLAAALAPLWLTMRAEKFEDSRVRGTTEAAERAWWVRLVDRAFRDAGESRGVTPECFDEIFLHFAKGEAWRVPPDVVPALEAFRARGLALGVLSNFDYRLRSVLDDHGLTRRFDTLTISSEAGWEKPHPGIYRIAMESLGVAPGESVMSGDDWEHDVEGPTAQGMRAFWLRRRGTTEAKPHITSLLEILPHLD